MVVAAGSGTRLGADIPKAFVTVAGRTLLEHALDRVAASGVVDDVVVVLPPDAPPSLLPVILQKCRVVAGGATRQESVRRGLEALPGDADVVLVHDAARCLAPPSLIGAVVAAVRAGHDAVVPAIAVPDTIRSLDGGAVDRARLRAVQTPQGFSRQALLAAHASTGGDHSGATDDATLAERCGSVVHVIEGDPLAFKVTTPLDLRLATAVLAAAS